ncbi:MAG: tRNA uridine-5-carboxymethylaminomethyl(34) synthesis GTPase MnmE, partial [Erysipelotrichaceae bacterium]|nr:tRNA uridine-5-carboxymethylaminomethyl(34) synthesis GTPase MnmE [Erysipelotrichaceae bacterium]
MLNDTICAISTAVKDGAISIVRMSGEESFDIIRKISDVSEIKPNTIVYSHIRKDGEMLDEVLISFFEAGKSYTFEDMVEINCHGGVYVTRQILNLLLENGCRLAEPGEFTKRAYLNGRINLSQADAVNDLVKAESSVQARSAIRGLNGSIERL